MEAVAQQLASSTRRIVDEVCKDHAAWAPQLDSAPTPGSRLDGGYNHHVQLIETPGQRWVLRIDKQNRDTSHRERELAIQTQAAACKIAPGILFSDPKRGITVMEWIDAQQDAQNTAADFAGLLRAIHALPPLGECLESTAVLQRYQTAIKPESSLAELMRTGHSRINKAVSELGKQKNIATVLCHNDLLRANCLRSKDRLYALDWEYAAPGDAFFDLAVCASDLPGRVNGELLELYLQRPATQAEQRRFKAQSLVYACIEACWFSVHHSSSNQASLSHRKLAEFLLNGAPQ
ncbi:choline/ethanolamine kinase family protein [Congregibacter variabilis]|uniref:Choline/ethanolamine kinase family protein n=1 Tax=Congregibacter variabilis TaxID=3081200 RepID=A0ABZ0I8N5_9GAMM|nr:choline/ethanolamine kinase family protein [Congregibacter sp. IMCC43200]